MVASGCREYQEPLPFEDCQPYQLECAACVIEEDLARSAGLRRHYRCEIDDGTQYDAVLRDGDLPDMPTEDVHYYNVETGIRMAAERRYEELVDVCGEERDVEWYGLILDDCEVVCEIDPTLADADDTLPEC